MRTSSSRPRLPGSRKTRGRWKTGWSRNRSTTAISRPAWMMLAISCGIGGSTPRPGSGHEPRERRAQIRTDEIAQPRTLPAGRTTRKPRKPPSASIPGDLDDLPTASDESEPQTGTISFKSPGSTSRRPKFPDDSSRSALRGRRAALATGRDRSRSSGTTQVIRRAQIDEPVSAWRELRRPSFFRRARLRLDCLHRGRLRWDRR